MEVTGGQAAVRSLVAHGVTDIFGLPGVQNDWFYNAIYDEGRPFNVYTARHEQGAAYMALGYAVTSRRIGVLSVVPGPGLLNASAGIATGFGLGARMVALAGQIPSQHIDKGIGFLHEIVDQPAAVRNVTKWQGRAMAASEISPLVAQAFRHVATGDARPVLLELPPDVLRATTGAGVTAPLDVVQPTVDRAELAQAVRLIAEAASPLIVVGGGALEASESVTELAELLDCPVTFHRRGRGVIDERHPLAVPYTIAHDLWPEVDVVIAIGTRLQIQLLDWGADGDLRQVWINPDPSAARRIGSPDATLAARAEDALPMLLQLLDGRVQPRAGRAAELERRRRQEADRISVLEPQLAYLSVIRAALGETGILVTDLTQVGYVTRAAFNVYAPRTFVFPGYPGTLGYGYPTALGAKVANPDRIVIATVGDGGFMFTATEMATAVQYGISTITIVFDDAAFGNVQLMQREMYDGRVHATDLTNPDFVAMAEAFGVLGLRADGGPEALARAIDVAKEAGRPCVIVVPQGKWPNPWPVLTTGRVRGG